MKFYSEKLDQMFDSIEELESAEKKPKKIAKAIKKETTEPAELSRKELASEVEKADEAVKKAYADYEAAKLKVEELSKKYLKEVDAILEPAKKSVKDAERARYEKIKQFNDAFGAYQVTYTGAKAADEMIKAVNSINERARRLFGDFFWI